MSTSSFISIHAAQELCVQAALTQGASQEVASSLAAATIAAECRGQASVGISHFFDYLEAMPAGRLNGAAVPSCRRPTQAVFVSDANGGIAHLGFDQVFDDLVNAARALGIALFSQKNAYTCGALGYFPERLAEQGLVAFAVSNNPALIAANGAKTPIYGTNPMAFATPQGDGPVMLIDQASSATAFVNIRAAAAQAKTLPEGWAIDKDGAPTTDPVAALAGSLLPFGGARGGNVALMIELLATMSGARWSMDAPDFVEGNECPGVGMFIVAINPALLDEDYATRVAAQLDRLRRSHNVFIPGFEKAEAVRATSNSGISVEPQVLAKLRSYAQSRNS